MHKLICWNQQPHTKVVVSFIWVFSVVRTLVHQGHSLRRPPSLSEQQRMHGQWNMSAGAKGRGKASHPLHSLHLPAFWTFPDLWCQLTGCMDCLIVKAAQSIILPVIMQFDVYGCTIVNYCKTLCHCYYRPFQNEASATLMPTSLFSHVSKKEKRDLVST